MKRVGAFSCVALAAMSLVACASSAKKGIYADCMRDPQGYGDGSARDGYISQFKFEVDGYGRPEEAFAMSMKRHDCLADITIKGPGREFNGGPYRYMIDEQFTANYVANRVAFYYYLDDHQSFVWIDGAIEGPYYDIGIKPRFSDNGRHVAYAVMTPSGTQRLIIDGKVATEGRRFIDNPFFDVLDDGRVAAPRYTGKKEYEYEYVIGGFDAGGKFIETVSPPIEEACSNSGFQAQPKGHWSYAAKIAGSWSVVIDGQDIASPGVPAGCNVVFTPDGAHYGFLALGSPSTSPRPAWVVLDGVSRPVPGEANDFLMNGHGVPIVKLSIIDRSGVSPLNGGYETGILVAGVATPQPMPTDDGYLPPDRGPGSPREWARVRIGTSIGPRFDSVAIESIEIDPVGSVRYVGTRGSTKSLVVDNVIQPGYLAPAQ